MTIDISKLQNYILQKTQKAQLDMFYSKLATFKTIFGSEVKKLASLEEVTKQIGKIEALTEMSEYLAKQSYQNPPTANKKSNKDNFKKSRIQSKM